MSDDEKTDKREGQIKGYGTAVPVPKTFRAIDALFAEPVEYAREALQTYFDRKKVENLVAHAQAVRQANKDRTPPTGNPSIHQLELLDQ